MKFCYFCHLTKTAPFLSGSCDFSPGIPPRIENHSPPDDDAPSGGLYTKEEIAVGGVTSFRLVTA